jgi:hypothetical protein
VIKVRRKNGRLNKLEKVSLELKYVIIILNKGIVIQLLGRKLV